MKYLVYQITNLVNGKIYIGFHQTQNINDNYMGSGKLLKVAFKKYGIENFKKTILFVFDNLEDMKDCEAKLVNEEFVQRQDTYNLKVGGEGGFDFINSNPDIQGIAARTRTKEEQIRIGKLGGKAASEKNSKRFKELHKQGLFNYCTFKGKTHSEETKQKMSNSHKGKHKGNKNSQFGTMWINNGLENRKIKKDDIIPEGFTKGRLMKLKL